MADSVYHSANHIAAFALAFKYESSNENWVWSKRQYFRPNKELKKKKKTFRQINQPCSFIKIVIYLFIYLLDYY